MPWGGSHAWTPTVQLSLHNVYYRWVFYSPSPLSPFVFNSPPRPLNPVCNYHTHTSLISAASLLGAALLLDPGYSLCSLEPKLVKVIIPINDT